MLLNCRKFVALLTSVKMIHFSKVKHRFLKTTLSVTLVCGKRNISAVYNYWEILSRERDNGVYKNTDDFSN